MNQLGFNATVRPISASRLQRKSILEDRGVNLCVKCKTILQDSNEREQGHEGQIREIPLREEELLREDINANKSIISKVAEMKKVIARKRLTTKVRIFFLNINIFLKVIFEGQS